VDHQEVAGANAEVHEVVCKSTTAEQWSGSREKQLRRYPEELSQFLRLTF
jgi:hypothetical protein